MQAPKFSVDSMTKAAHGSIAPAADDLVAMLGLARGLTFVQGRLERGPRLRPAERSGPGAHRSTDPTNAVLGGLEFRGMMSAPDAHFDVSGAHPLYGRYVQQFMGAQPSSDSGKVLLRMLQTKLGDLKDTIRRVL
jgi:hypothetical protein